MEQDKKMIKILKVLANKLEIEEKFIGTKLKDLQREVNGIIEHKGLGDDFDEIGIEAIVNEEGLLYSLDASLMIFNEEQKPIDGIYGPAIFVSCNEDGETIGLNEKQINFIKRKINSIAMFGQEKVCLAMVPENA